MSSPAEHTPPFLSEPVPERRAVIVWRSPADAPEAVAKREASAKIARANAAAAEAREKAAEAQIKLTKARGVIADLVEREMAKYLMLSQDEAWARAVGPLAPEMVLKLAEWVSKENRLDNGKATEHIAHLVSPAIDFSKLTQEERDAWRRLAIKGGLPDE